MALATNTTRFLCLFHKPERARSAVAALEQSGISRTAINTLGGDDKSPAVADQDTLGNLGLPDRDLRHFHDGLRDGGVLVSLEAPESQSEVIESIFHRYSADKIDEADVAAPAAAEAVAPLASAAGNSAALGTTNDIVVPVSEEQLVVGKREVDQGGVRVYRRTVEEPVQQDVTLHNERVVLEYREVNRPATDADLRTGTQEVELIETAEVPVLQKVSRVVEEVHVGKVESDRTEVINETLRHTEVEVEPFDAGATPRSRE